MTGIRYRPSLVSVFASIALSLAAVPLTRLNQRHELASRDAEAAYWDHSGEIKAWAALGDSFSAGLGAGKRIDFVCSRYDQAYPNVVNENFYLGDKKDRDFKFLACSGVEADHVLKKQIPKLSDASLDMATLSIGGNDVGLKDLLNACVYQWWVGTKSGGYCEETLQNTQKTIDGPELSKSFDDILRELGKKMKKDAKIYWTSYSNFFCDDTRDCDKVTWSFKHNIGRRQYLTKERRETMNKLTQDLHGKIKDAIKRFGDQAVWVPWDDGVTAMHGRYCEAGVDENDAKAKDREQLVFFEWGTTVDDDPTLPPSDELRKRELPANPGDDETFEGEIGDLIQEAVKNGVDPVEFGLEKGSVPTEGDQEGGTGQQKESLTSWLLPDKYGRIFHPQKYGHLLIAEAVLRAMDTTKAQKLGQKAAVTTIVGVPMQTGAASHLGERNGCTADKKDKQSREFTVDEAKSRAEEFCLKAIETDVDVGNDGLLDQYPNGDDDGKTKFATSSIVYQVTLSTDPKCDKYPNKGKMNYYYCLDTFQDAVNGCKYSLSLRRRAPPSFFLLSKYVSLKQISTLANFLSPSTRRHPHPIPKTRRHQNQRLHDPQYQGRQGRRLHQRPMQSAHLAQTQRRQQKEQRRGRPHQHRHRRAGHLFPTQSPSLRLFHRRRSR